MAKSQIASRAKEITSDLSYQSVAFDVTRSGAFMLMPSAERDRISSKPTPADADRKAAK